MISWLKYVTHAQVPAYEAAGWVFAADLGLPHSFFSILMRWAGEGDPPGTDRSPA
jgi:hypothetical protein